MERRLIDANALGIYKYVTRDAFRGFIEVIPYGLVLTAPTISAVEVVRCRECKQFWEYSEEHKATVENADGDCAIRKWRSDDEQFCAVTKDDYCSLGKRREPDENNLHG